MSRCQEEDEAGQSGQICARRAPAVRRAVPPPAMQQLVLDIRAAAATHLRRLRRRRQCGTCIAPALPGGAQRLRCDLPVGDRRAAAAVICCAPPPLRRMPGGGRCPSPMRQEIGAELALPPGGLLIVDDVERLGPTAPDHSVSRLQHGAPDRPGAARRRPCAAGESRSARGFAHARRRHADLRGETAQRRGKGRGPGAATRQAGACGWSTASSTTCCATASATCPR
ncbi:MAG: hypothetical protein MZW92_38050 [Comamonadaceae bacterium]|nr:hypothetical protein [Comamonadaceae bacterium]